jgi:uncharacterized circularly permuted ATP-grasp superfamily protein
MTSIAEATSRTESYNEAYAAPGRPRPHYRRILGALEQLELTSLTGGVRTRIERAGATFGADPFAVCPLPRLIEGREWRSVAAGLKQRALALSAFVEDCYGAQEIVEAGVVPARVIDQAEGYEPELRGQWPGRPAALGVIAFDIVRAPDGEMLVLEDNARTPSGFAYAVAARDAVTTTLAELEPAGARAITGPVQLAPAAIAGLRGTMLDAANAVRDDTSAAHAEPTIVVLSGGPGGAAFYEHATAARWLQVPLVMVEDLERRASELWLRANGLGPARRIDAVYRRTESDRLRDHNGSLTPIARLLLEPWLTGRLALVNGFGTGVADDKLAQAYVEQMIGFYLGEEPLLRSVETLDLSEPLLLERVLSDLCSHVVKPRHGHGGRGVVVCAHADAAELRRVEAALRRPGAGAEYVAQPTVPLSVHPTVVGERLSERHIDLRPFAFASRDGVTPIPGGLTRVALDAGTLVVNSSQDGGAKDTWVLP